MDVNDMTPGTEVWYVEGMDIRSSPIYSVKMGDDYELTHTKRTIQLMNGKVLTSDEVFESHQKARNFLIEKAYES